MKKLLLLLFIGWAAMAMAQEAGSRVEGELIVRLYKDADLPKLMGQFPDLRIERQLSKNLNVWLLEYNPDQFSGDQLIYALAENPLIWEVQHNHYLENRATVPNDPNFGQQWQYVNTGSGGGTVDADIDAELAWDYATGGVTPLGDTIVVCIIDDGIDLTHQDMLPNLWRNWDEIPGNGIDDDGNGYVDDDQGWDADGANGDISGGAFGGWHGTPVAGIVGAKGNNGIGVTGVSWDVKLMIVVGGGDEAAAIAAYDYPLTERKLYNQTNGQQGAFVVATNASWGIDNRLESSFPILCAFYDSLGTAGILNAAATANANTNIDVQGDLPTHCSSDYLIAVTNTNDDDLKVTQAGYGSVSIDLGAPGEGTYTAALNNTYGGFGGTSGATPHVAGAVGLLYSAPCAQFAALSKSDPAAATLLMKNYLMQGTDITAQLDTLTVSGGRLNLHGSMLELLNAGCSLAGCYAPFGQQLITAAGTTATVNWLSVPSATVGYLVRYREQGTTTWTNTTTVDTFYNFTGLTACTFYEVELASDCDTTQGSYSNTFTFKTGDCCEAPTVIDVDSLGENAILLSWGQDANVNSYTVEYQLDGDTSWQTSSTSTNGILLDNLVACSDYNLRIISSCAVNVNNEYSQVLRFRTLGCGNCEDLNYCTSEGGSTDYEWIDQVVIGDLNNTSGDDGGYAFFPTLTPTFYSGHQYPLSLTLDVAGAPSANWRWKVWIDLDQDGDFDATNELVFDSNPITTTNFTFSDSLAIPSTAVLGNTRMRVSMKWGTSGTHDQCASFSYGEVEDYCINIATDPTSIATASSMNIGLKVFPVPMKEFTTVEINWPRISAGASLELVDVLGRRLKEQLVNLEQGVNQFQIDIRELPSGVYWVLLRLEDGTILSQKVQR
jgi:serine protease